MDEAKVLGEEATTMAGRTDRQAGPTGTSDSVSADASESLDELVRVSEGPNAGEVAGDERGERGGAQKHVHDHQLDADCGRG
jgi:hypothetical protein